MGIAMLVLNIIFFIGISLILGYKIGYEDGFNNRPSKSAAMPRIVPKKAKKKDKQKDAQLQKYEAILDNINVYNGSGKNQKKVPI